MTIYCGIDLGTSFCCVYYLKNGTMKVLTMDDGKHAFPSVVNYRDDGSVLVGASALRAGDIAKGKVVMNWKRLFGKDYDEDYKKNVELSCRANVINNKGKYAFSVPSRDYPISPEMVCSEILKWIHKKMLVIAEGDTIEYCITLPAAYSIQQKMSMHTVVDISGINCNIKFVTEPAAAAVSYSIENKINDGYILVYDLGGGTFDASILKIENRHYKVLKWNGNIDIGGEKFNMEILHWVNRRFREDIDEYLLPETDNERNDAKFIRAQMLLLDQCCEAKTRLTSESLTEIDIGQYFKSLYKKSKNGNQIEEEEDIDEQDMTFAIDRTTFNGLIENHINSTLQTVRACLSDISMDMNNISYIVMVGGSSQIPFVYDALCNEFGQDKISRAVNCSECVASGAALFIASRDIMDVTITECATRDVYISTRPGRYRCMIKAGSEIPAEGQYKYYLSEDNIGYATAMIYENSADGESYEPVGEMVIEDESLIGRRVDLIYKFRLENDFKLTTSFSEGDNVLDERKIQVS